MGDDVRIGFRYFADVRSLIEKCLRKPGSGTAVKVFNLFPFAASRSAAITAMLEESRPPVITEHGGRKDLILAFTAASRRSLKASTYSASVANLTSGMFSGSQNRAFEKLVPLIRMVQPGSTR